MQVKIEVIEGTVHVVGPYSTDNNDVWRSLGGKFTGGRWVLPDNETVRKKIAAIVGGNAILPLDVGKTTIDIQVDGISASLEVTVEEDKALKKK